MEPIENLLIKHSSVHPESSLPIRIILSHFQIYGHCLECGWDINGKILGDNLDTIQIIPGINVYLTWKGFTKADFLQQLTGFSPIHGHIGYLRETYGKKPYAIEEFIKERWEDQPVDLNPLYEDWEYNPNTGFDIPNSVLQERLPKVLEVARKHYQNNYGLVLGIKHIFLDSYINFVSLHKKMEFLNCSPRIKIIAQ